ncbi:MAG: hypothetical protein WC744_02090 [Patescibacteria group bacterium]|jgi:hypothetical protein
MTNIESTIVTLRSFRRSHTLPFLDRPRYMLDPEKLETQLRQGRIPKPIHWTYLHTKHDLDLVNNAGSDEIAGLLAIKDQPSIYAAAIINHLIVTGKSKLARESIEKYGLDKVRLNIDSFTKLINQMTEDLVPEKEITSTVRRFHQLGLTNWIDKRILTRLKRKELKYVLDQRPTQKDVDRYFSRFRDQSRLNVSPGINEDFADIRILHAGFGLKYVGISTWRDFKGRTDVGAPIQYHTVDGLSTLSMGGGGMIFLDPKIRIAIFVPLSLMTNEKKYFDPKSIRNWLPEPQVKIINQKTTK